MVCPAVGMADDARLAPHSIKIESHILSTSQHPVQWCCGAVVQLSHDLTCFNMLIGFAYHYFTGVTYLSYLHVLVIQAATTALDLAAATR